MQMNDNDTTLIPGNDTSPRRAAAMSADYERPCPA